MLNKTVVTSERNTWLRIMTEWKQEIEQVEKELYD